MLITQINGSEITPLYGDITLYANSDQTIRLTLQPAVSGGIASQSFLLEVKSAYSDTTPALAIAGTINDATGCVVDFVIPAASVVAFVGRYVYNVRRTDGGNSGPLSFGQVRAIQAA